MATNLRHSGQRRFLELHALLAGPEVAPEIEELAESVSCNRVLALYPFDLAETAITLQTHLSAPRLLPAFSKRLAGWAKSSRYSDFRRLLSPEHNAVCTNDWIAFYAAWHRKPLPERLDLQTKQDHFFSVLDAFEVLWMGAHWNELRELHSNVKALDWALGELGEDLRHFIKPLAQPVETKVLLSA